MSLACFDVGERKARAQYKRYLRALAERAEMLSKSGLHPYRAGLFFILRESKDVGPKARAALVAGDVEMVSHRSTVRLLAHAFDKTNRQVARDLIDTYRALENGAPAP